MTSKTRLVTTYVATDMISTALAVLLFNVTRYSMLNVSRAFYTLTDFLTSPTVMAGQILFPLGMLAIYYMSGYYSNVFHRSRVVEFTTTLTTAAAGTLVIIFVALINDLTHDRAQDYRVFFVVFFLLFVLVYIPRLLITAIVSRNIRTGKIFFPTAVAGTGNHPELFKAFDQVRLPRMGLRRVTNINLDTATPESIRKDIERHGIKRFIVLPHPDGWEPTLEMINHLYPFDLPIFVSARDLPAHLLNQRLVSFTADPLIDMSHAHFSAATLCSKRAMDIVVSGVMMIITALPVALLALAVKMDSPGPAFFVQERVGRHRRPFNMYKLRTMRHDAEGDGCPRLSSPGDKRITRLGNTLRKYRLDELPQFFNVLRGDMSLVGPRPERLVYVEQMEAAQPSHALLHRIRPGITSLGMVKYGYASSLEQMLERMKYDMMYLQNVSILSDIKILLYTVKTVFSGKGI